MACPYCTKLYFILTVFVAPRCGGTLFFCSGDKKHENSCERVSKEKLSNLSKKEKKDKKLFLK